MRIRNKTKKINLEAALEELVRCSHALALQSRRQLEALSRVLKDREASVREVRKSSLVVVHFNDVLYN